MAPNLPQIWTAWSAKIEIITILYMLNMLETNNIRQKKYWKKHTLFEAKMLGNQLFCFVLMLTEIPPRDPTQAPPNQHQNHQRPPKDHRDTTETHQEVTDKPRHHRDTIDTAPWHYRDAPPRPAPRNPRRRLSGFGVNSPKLSLLGKSIGIFEMKKLYNCPMQGGTSDPVVTVVLPLQCHSVEWCRNQKKPSRGSKAAPTCPHTSASVAADPATQQSTIAIHSCLDSSLICSRQQSQRCLSSQVPT